MSYGNYSYVIPAYYNPISLDDMMKAANIYKENYDKMEEQYVDLKDKAGTFAYLSQALPQDSDARKVYEGYANDLNAAAEDFLQNGLLQGSRKTLTDLRGRYSGEIGQLVKADEALQQERQLRAQRAAKDPSMRYAVDNLSIDDFMYGRTPNLYNVSVNDLYARGVNAGKAASSRKIQVGEGSMTLGGYYRDMVTKTGYPNAADFRRNIEAIPEMRDAYNDMIKEFGIDNLTGANRAQAEQGLINGIMDGMVYTENHNPIRDVAKLNPLDHLQMDKFKLDKANAEQQLKEDKWMYTYDTEGNITGYNPKYIEAKQQQALTKAGEKPTVITKKTIVFNSGDDPDDEDFDETKAEEVDEPLNGILPRDINELNNWPESVKRRLKSEIDPNHQHSYYDKDGKLIFTDFILDLYQIGYRKQSGWGPWNTHAGLEIIKKTGATSLKVPRQNPAQAGATSQAGEGDYSNIGAE